MKKPVAAFLKIIRALILILIIPATGQAQTDLVKEWKGRDDLPYILYISGDGGFNNFSSGLCREMNAAGYSVGALNAKEYFWDKKTPEGTAKDISLFLSEKLKERPGQPLLLIGYSFGADVMPFVVNRLAPEWSKKIKCLVLLSPSVSTDFEVHWTDLFGVKKKRSMDVPAEINRLQVPKLVTIFGEAEDDFPVDRITLKNFINVRLPGGHHFGGNAAETAQTILSYCR